MQIVEHIHVTIRTRKGQRFDLRFLALRAVLEGADYAYLAWKHLRNTHMLKGLDERTLYRVMLELEREGYLVSHLDGDVKSPPDEWLRRIYSMTDAGRVHFNGLCDVYGADAKKF